MGAGGRDAAAGRPALVTFVEDALAALGRRTLSALESLGALGILLRNVVATIPETGKTARLTVVQMLTMGVNSLPLVILTATFTGAVTAVQAAYQFQGWVPLRYLGTVVCKSVVIELGPVLTALVVGGRVGSSVAAELGTMKVTEQIDAIEVLGIDSTRFLILPRILALSIMLPVITIFADIVAILGAYVVATATLDISTHTYVVGLRTFFKAQDVYGGLFKALFFGFTISLMGCFFGTRTEGGAEGVGRATTNAVVSSCLLILVLDYFLATVLFRIIFV